MIRKGFKLEGNALEVIGKGSSIFTAGTCSLTDKVSEVTVDSNDIIDSCIPSGTPIANHEMPIDNRSGVKLTDQNLSMAGQTLLLRYIQFRRISLTGFPPQSVRSSNAVVLDSPYLLVLITETSQSRQHESRKSPTTELFDDDSGRISIHHCEY
ncbi:hypothetical protein Tco_1156774 [Tanacetum coccineum]